MLISEHVLALFLIFSNSLMRETKSSASNTVQVKSVKCTFNADYIEKAFCRVKPTRDGDGNTTVTAVFKRPTNDFWAHLVLYYKYQRFQRFMINSDEDICKHVNGWLIRIISFCSVRSLVPTYFILFPIHSTFHSLYILPWNQHFKADPRMKKGMI